MDLTPIVRKLESILGDLPADATRLFHGRGHCYPDLAFINIDWFDPVIWVVLYGDVADDVAANVLALLTAMAQESDRVACVSVQRRVNGKAQQEVIYGEMPPQCIAREDGARYELNFSSNQNIGFFLDARPARQWLRKQAPGCAVLNLFAYTCSFSVAALQGGAESVVNIDMAKPSLAIGQRNHALNELDTRGVRFLPHDIFRSTGKLRSNGPYDIVVIDPPSKQRGSFEAVKDYARLLKKIEPMLAPGARILACLNAPFLGEDFLLESVAGSLEGYECLSRLPQREDFPEQDLNRCLKMQVFSRTVGS